MPQKDGREALREIKADPKLRSIRVVILTTSKAEEDIYRTYDLAAASYITKPVTFDGLVDVIRTLGKYWLEIVELPGERRRRVSGRCETPTTGDCYGEAPIRVLLIEDDEDDYLLTRDLLAEIGGRQVRPGLGGRLRAPAWTALPAAATTLPRRLPARPARRAGTLARRWLAGAARRRSSC